MSAEGCSFELLLAEATELVEAVRLDSAVLSVSGVSCSVPVPKTTPGREFKPPIVMRRRH